MRSTVRGMIASQGRALLAVLGIVAGVLPQVLQGQQPSDAPSGTLVAGIGMATPLIVDGNGTTVSLAVAPTIALHLRPRGWRAGPLDVGIVVRAANSRLRLGDGGEHWSGGRAWQADFLAEASMAWPHPGVRLSAGAGTSWLRSYRRTSPLQRATFAPAAEATVIVRPTGSRWGIAVTGQGYRLRPRNGRSGGVARLVAGVARAF